MKLSKRLLSIVELKDLDGELLLEKNKVYECLSEIQCNQVKVRLEDKSERFIHICYFRILE